mmetsp:Transcript_31612/g.38671  ORF Transcript_31612/g.38671 Transcript_31612/m.38671 type:complete len:381 (+) Transcript_31612:121-1263(+)|eukprot:CAMPEP_0172510346 /NCGR_PEP_ID=MMETSP1066-20121228/227788_1 /TAXON_ID=671091 /ORGANISM="Coscinodiscus wailesii, Strain CCMP2513" /LENGTH=380 /DNA_ID=CAMNT_0013289259 /DNA_START=105 /DNA_END=1247 /DNA_ORIENTATION=-
MERSGKRKKALTVKGGSKMKTWSTTGTICFLILSYTGIVTAWSHSSVQVHRDIDRIQLKYGLSGTPRAAVSQSPLFQQRRRVSGVIRAAGATSSTSTGEPSSDKKANRLAQIKSEGGKLAFSTKYGALNPYAVFYGLTSIFLGIAWYMEMMACKVMYFLTRNKFDPKRRLPIFFSQVWGETLMFLTRAYPKVENRHILKEFYKTGKAAMFVANHNSWQDIPYLGYTIGWRNYKIIAKKELEKVPILSSAIIQGGHVIVDRTNRRSQLMTLKNGMKWLQEGVHLCTFPEGTRSRSGRLQPFKNGAFKMAYKVGAPVIPLSIVGAGDVMPSTWMFPKSASKNIAKVVVHEPIYPEGKTEEEMANEVRQAVISGLPENQRPLD